MDTRDSNLDAFIPFVTMSDREALIMNILLDAHSVDGGHHKQWYIEMALRVMAGSNYDKLVALYQGWDEENNEVIYEWDEGIAP